MMPLSEYAARVRRLRAAVPNLVARFDEHEGLTLIGTVGNEQVAMAGETDIIIAYETAAATALLESAAKLGEAIEAMAFGGGR